MTQSHAAPENHWSSGGAFIKQPQCGLSGRKTAWWLIVASLSNNVWPVKRISIQSLSNVRAHPKYNGELWKATDDKSASILWPSFSKVFLWQGLRGAMIGPCYLTLGPGQDISTDTSQVTIKCGIESKRTIILVTPWPFVLVIGPTNRCSTIANHWSDMTLFSSLWWTFL